MDTSDLLFWYEVSKYRMLVGFSNWSFTLEIFGVHFSLSTMGRYNFAPKKLHLGSILRIFGYLKYHMELQIICDTGLLQYNI